MTTYIGTSSTMPNVIENQFESQLKALISRSRNLDLDSLRIGNTNLELPLDEIVSQYSEGLRRISNTAEADALDDAHEKIIDSKNFGGLDLRGVKNPSQEQQREAL